MVPTSGELAAGAGGAIASESPDDCAAFRRLSDEWTHVLGAEDVLKAVHERSLLGLELGIRQDAGPMQFS